MTTNVRQPLVLAITLCGLLEAQALKQPPKAAPAAASRGGGNPITLAFHDAPIIVSDGSVSVLFQTSFFFDLGANSKTLSAQDRKKVLDANPNQNLQGALISHTHARCSALTIPLTPKSPYQCPSQCVTAPSTDPVKHHLLVLHSNQILDFPLQDCDTIGIVIVPAQAASIVPLGGRLPTAPPTQAGRPFPSQITIGMEFVEQFAHSNTSPQVAVMPTNNIQTPKVTVTPSVQTVPMRFVAQTMAWVVRTSPNPGLLNPLGVTTANGDLVEKFETASAFRLESVVVHRAGAVALKPIPLADGCSAVDITDDHFDPSSTSTLSKLQAALPARCHPIVPALQK